MRNYLKIRIIFSIALIFVVFLYTVVLNQDRNLIKAIYQSTPQAQYIDPVFDGLPYYEQWEKLAVEIFNYQINNNQVNCTELKKYASKLIQASKRGSQGYYLLTACAEREGDIDKALEFAQLALKYDVLNTQYLMALAVLNLNSGDLSAAKTYLDKIAKIDPDTFNYKNILRVYNERIINNNS
jgi:tetratricopeptide (TPR) repeat protein